MPIVREVPLNFQPVRREPVITEVHRVLERVGHDPFIDDLSGSIRSFGYARAESRRIAREAGSA